MTNDLALEQRMKTNFRFQHLRQETNSRKVSVDMFVIIVFRSRCNWPPHKQPLRPPVIVVMILNGLSLSIAEATVATVNVSRVIYLHVLFLIWLQRQLTIRRFLLSLVGLIWFGSFSCISSLLRFGCSLFTLNFNFYAKCYSVHAARDVFLLFSWP